MGKFLLGIKPKFRYKNQFVTTNRKLLVAPKVAPLVQNSGIIAEKTRWTKHMQI